MKWASAVSEQETLDAALEECVSSVRDELQELAPDLVAVFVSGDFAERYDDVPGILRERLGPGLLFGCSAGGVIGGGREVERRPGFSLTAAHLPDVEMSPFHISGDDLPDMDAPPDAWQKAINVPTDGDPHFLLLVDPFSFPTQDFVAGLDYAYGGSIKVGGMASSAHQPGDNALFLGDTIHRSGGIGIAMRGNIAVDTVVAQGCRPVGKVMSITKSQQNLLIEMDQRPPVDVLRELLSSASERDQELMQHSLALGIAMDDIMEEPQHGSFLIRNIIGLDSRSGVMAVGEMLREGQRVQFHLRDAVASADDLSALLTRYAKEERSSPCEGALLFSCNGRGQHLYGRPDHDTDLFREVVGTVPLGGFFCAGEIGQVGGSTFLHGQTSSFGLFRPLRDG